MFYLKLLWNYYSISTIDAHHFSSSKSSTGWRAGHLDSDIGACCPHCSVTVCFRCSCCSFMNNCLCSSCFRNASGAWSAICWRRLRCWWGFAGIGRGFGSCGCCWLCAAAMCFAGSWVRCCLLVHFCSDRLEYAIPWVSSHFLFAFGLHRYPAAPNSSKSETSCFTVFSSMFQNFSTTICGLHRWWC